MLLGVVVGYSGLQRRIRLELVSGKTIRDKFGISYSTLLRWVKKGYLNPVRLPSGRLRFYEDEVGRVCGDVDQRV